MVKPVAHGRVQSGETMNAGVGGWRKGADPTKRPISNKLDESAIGSVDRDEYDAQANENRTAKTASICRQRDSLRTRDCTDEAAVMHQRIRVRSAEVSSEAQLRSAACRVLQ